MNFLDFISTKMHFVQNLRPIEKISHIKKQHTKKSRFQYFPVLQNKQNKLGFMLKFESSENAALKLECPLKPIVTEDLNMFFLPYADKKECVLLFILLVNSIYMLSTPKSYFVKICVYVIVLAVSHFGVKKSFYTKKDISQ